MHALLALAVVVPICLVVTYLIKAQMGSERRLNAPTRDLAIAVRLLDRAAEADEVMPYMSSETREEVAAFLRRYHGREIGK